MSNRTNNNKNELFLLNKEKYLRIAMSDINIAPINTNDSYDNIMVNLKNRIDKNLDKNEKVNLILATYLLEDKLKNLETKLIEANYNFISLNKDTEILLNQLKICKKKVNQLIININKKNNYFAIFFLLNIYFMFFSFDTFLNHIYHIFIFILAILITIYEIIVYDIFHLNKAVIISSIHCIYVNWDNIINSNRFKKLKNLFNYSN